MCSVLDLSVFESKTPRDDNVSGSDDVLTTKAITRILSKESKKGIQVVRGRQVDVDK